MRYEWEEEKGAKYCTHNTAPASVLSTFSVPAGGWGRNNVPWTQDESTGAHNAEMLQANLRLDLKAPGHNSHPPFLPFHQTSQQITEATDTLSFHIPIKPLTLHLLQHVKILPSFHGVLLCVSELCLPSTECFCVFRNSAFLLQSASVCLGTASTANMHYFFSKLHWSVVLVIGISRTSCDVWTDSYVLFVRDASQRSSRYHSCIVIGRTTVTISARELNILTLCPWVDSRKFWKSASSFFTTVAFQILSNVAVGGGEVYCHEISVTTAISPIFWLIIRRLQIP
jgi:hypothetical protein